MFFDADSTLSLKVLANNNDPVNFSPPFHRGTARTRMASRASAFLNNDPLGFIHVE